MLTFFYDQNKKKYIIIISIHYRFFELMSPLLQDLIPFLFNRISLNKRSSFKRILWKYGNNELR